MRPALDTRDLDALTELHHIFLPKKDRASCRTWIASHMAAFPIHRIFIMRRGKQPIGYVHWSEQDGIGSEVTLRLTQLVLKNDRDAEFLLNDSLEQIRQGLERRDRVLSRLEAEGSEYEEYLARKFGGSARLLRLWEALLEPSAMVDSAH